MVAGCCAAKLFVDCVMLGVGTGPLQCSLQHVQPYSCACHILIEISLH